MPIEIRELYIKAVIDSGGGSKKAGDAQTGEGAPKSEGGGAGEGDHIVDLCVEKVMEILKEKEER
jgi:hypothetical protein